MTNAQEDKAAEPSVERVMALATQYADCFGDVHPAIGLEGVKKARNALESAIRALAAEREGDKARLDAIDQNIWFIEPDFHMGEWWVGKAVAFGRLQYRSRHGLRAAIDVARAALAKEHSNAP